MLYVAMSWTIIQGIVVVFWCVVWLVYPFLFDHVCQISHYNDVIMNGMASQITSLTSVYSGIYSGADQRKHLSSASLAFVWGIHWWLVISPHKWPITRKTFPFDDVIFTIIQGIMDFGAYFGWFIQFDSTTCVKFPITMTSWWTEWRFTSPA